MGYTCDIHVGYTCHIHVHVHYTRAGTKVGKQHSKVLMFLWPVGPSL